MKRATKQSGRSIQRFEPDSEVVYSIAAVERLAHLPRRTILIYCRHGLVSPAADPELAGYYFSGSAIRALRWIEHLQVNCGVNLAGIKLILDLTDAIEQLKTTSAGNALSIYSIPTKE